MYIYEYDRIKIDYNIEKIDDFEEYIFHTIYKEEFHRENEKQYVQIFTPEQRPIGDIIFIHGLGGNNLKYLRWFARYYKKNGYRTSIVVMPYHYKRKPADLKDGTPFYSADPDKCVIMFHNAVKDVRRTIDLVENLDGYNPKKLFLTGFSFGGIVGTMAMAIDKRIKKGNLIITGGNWRWINFYSPYTEFIRKEYNNIKNAYGCSGEEFCVKKYRKNPIDFINKNFLTINDIFEKSPIPCYEYDPISFAKFVNQEILFFQGIFDKIMPKKASSELYYSFPNAKRKLIPSGHKTSILLKKKIGKCSLEFFNKSL